LERLRGSLNFGNEVLQPPDGVGDEVEVPGGGPLIEDPQSIMELLDPDVTIPEKVLARADGSGTDLRSRADPLEEVMWAPSFDRPMFDPLRKLSEEYLLPGADDIERKTIGAVSTNPEFVESFMVSRLTATGRTSRSSGTMSRTPPAIPAPISKRSTAGTIRNSGETSALRTWY